MHRNKFDSDYWETYTDTEECDRRRDEMNLQQQLEEYEKLSENLPQRIMDGPFTMHDLGLQPQPLLGSVG